VALISVREAADKLGLRSPGSIYRKIKEGALATVDGKLEEEGLADRWRQVSREKRHRASDPVSSGGEDPPPRKLPRPQRQRQAPAPRQKPAAPSSTDADTQEEADFYVYRGLNEKEKYLINKLTRLEKAKTLVYKEDFEAAYAAVLSNLMLGAESLSRQIRTDIPHLTQQECDKIQSRIDDLFRAISDNTFEELDA
jgi:hypothetical protein